MTPGLLRSVRTLLPVVLGLLLTLPAWAAIPVPESSSRSLGGVIEVMEDPSGGLTLEQVRQSDDWEGHADTTFNEGYSQSAWWLRWSVTNRGDTARERILSIDYPLLRDLRLHMKSEGASGWEQLRLGASLPFSERPLENRRFVVPLSWEPGETRHFYLRVRTDSSFQVPLTIWKPSSFQAQSTTESIVHGIYLGALLAIGLYNLLLFVSVRHRNYLYYVGVVFSIALLVATINGYTFRYLWPTATDWNNQAIIVFFGLTIFFASFFTRNFLQVKQYSWWLDAIFRTVGLLGLLMALISGGISYYSAIVILLVMGVFCTVYGLVVALYIWSRGQQTAPYYLLAWSFLLIGLLILVLSKAGILPSNMFTDSAGQMGSFAEVLLLSFALAQRINIERRLRFQAQQEILDASERHNRELEERVHERTAELERVNERLNELSITDGLTGLKNRRYLDEALPREISRADRNGRPLSVIMIDIDHFKPLNDTYGHQAGDACLERIGKVLQANVRAPDIAVRYGGEEFALVLVEADSDGALRMLERLRKELAGTLVRHGGQELSFTISAGVASWWPDLSLSGEWIMRQADQALYRAKRQGRNQVCVYDESRDADTNSSCSAGS